MIDRIKIAVLAIVLMLCGFINAFAASESDEAGNLGIDINGFPQYITAVNWPILRMCL